MDDFVNLHIVAEEDITPKVMVNVTIQKKLTLNDGRVIYAFEASEEKDDE